MRFFERLNTPWAVVIALVVFLAIDGFLLYRYQLTMQAGATAPPATTEQSSAVSSNEESSSTAEEPKKEDPTTTEETSTAPPAAQEEEEEKADLLRAVIGVEELPAWLMVQVDGQTVLEEVSQPGFSSEFEADQEISIWTGNGGAVRVEVNGQDLGFLGASGEVTALELARGSAPGLT